MVIVKRSFKRCSLVSPSESKDLTSSCPIIVHHLKDCVLGQRGNPGALGIHYKNLEPKVEAMHGIVGDL